MEVDLGPLINLGGVGAVLAWFLFRAESKIDRLTSAVDRLTRAAMISVMADIRAPVEAKKLASDAIDELNKATGNGK